MKQRVVIKWDVKISVDNSLETLPSFIVKGVGDSPTEALKDAFNQLDIKKSEIRLLI